MKIRVRQLELNEIPVLKDFAPPDWKSDLESFFTFHFRQNYFYPIVAEASGKIVGCGCAIKNNTAGWLGNIIVLPEFRCQGIGEKITRQLMRFLDEHGYSIQLLIATNMGQPLYAKLGFKVSSYYHFYKIGRSISFKRSDSIRVLGKSDFKQVFELDKKVTRENRQRFIEQFLDTGWVYVSETAEGDIEGYFLPDFGDGLIIAKTNRSGMELMKLKLSNSQKIVIPEANISAKDFLRDYGFKEYSVCARMALNRDVDWKPEMIYSRASGYCG